MGLFSKPSGEATSEELYTVTTPAGTYHLSAPSQQYAKDMVAAWTGEAVTSVAPVRR
jgi:hypothetical protein